MGLYSRYVLPKIVHFICGLNPTTRQRGKVIPKAAGRVLEIGIGSGLNLPHYDADRVEHLWGLDPSSEMWSLAKEMLESTDLEVEFLEAGAEQIPLDDSSADTVVVTYSLCTIPEPVAALREMGRVLRAEGQLLFCEHGAAPDSSVRRWQDRVNPLWKSLSGGCNLNRDIVQLLEEGGFRAEDLETIYLPGWRPATFNYWGSARRT